MQLTETATGAPGRSRRGWALALTSVAFFMTSLDALVVVTALPAIHAGLGGSLGTLEWTVNAYTLPFAAGIITAAALGDKLGRRRMYVTGLALFTLASAACAVAPNASALIGARVIQGLGAALVTPLSLTILAAVFPPERRGAIVGIWGGIGGLAIAAGPLVGGGVVQGLDWHWIFWVNVPIGVAAALLARVRLPESRGPADRLDIGGLSLVAAGAVALAWGLVRTTDAGWGSTEVIIALSVGAALLAGFVVWEGRAANPMLPPQLLRIRAFAAANATGFLSMGAITSAAFFMSQFFQFSLGYSPLATGLRILPWTVTPLVIAPIAGKFTDRIGARPLMVAGMTLQAGGLAWVAADVSAATSYSELVLPLVIAGIGISMVIPATPTAALGALPPADIGRASGVLNTLQRFGAVFGVAIVTAVFSANGHIGSVPAVAAGVQPAIAASAGLSLAGALTGLAVARRRVPARLPEAVPEPALVSYPSVPQPARHPARLPVSR
ncbi:MAG: DHA2 family efflux MFS transporter permease subunit, partial [Actinobacteria bacterium]|nr:DHA2 family efflux MFS transporter permease subunit [Actinomycetota bacterium]